MAGRSITLIFYKTYKHYMSDIAKKVKDKIVDVKDKAVGSDDKEKQTGYTSSTENDPTKEYEASEPMSPAKIKEHEPTAVRRDGSSSSGSTTSSQDPKERLRRSGMTEGTAGSTETGDEYEQGAAGTTK
jgi:hypothetical protein